MSSVARFELVLLLLTAVIILELIARRFRMPPAAAFILGGIALALSPRIPDVEMDPDLVLVLFLPPLLLSGAYFTVWRDFRANLRIIMQLAIGAVVFTTAAVGFVVHWMVPSLPWSACFALGAIVSPPDAVAAKAVLQRIALPPRVTVLLEGESLVNDATGLVLFRFAVAAALTGTFSVGSAIGHLRGARHWGSGRWNRVRVARHPVAHADARSNTIGPDQLPGGLGFLHCGRAPACFRCAQHSRLRPGHGLEATHRVVSRDPHSGGGGLGSRDLHTGVVDLRADRPVPARCSVPPGRQPARPRQPDSRRSRRHWDGHRGPIRLDRSWACIYPRIFRAERRIDPPALRHLRDHELGRDARRGQPGRGAGAARGLRRSRFHTGNDVRRHPGDGFGARLHARPVDPLDAPGRVQDSQRQHVARR